MLSAAIAVALALWREARASANGAPGLRALSLFFWCLTLVFAFTLIDNIVERPDGVIIASVFITAIIVVSAFSRYGRSTELRATEIHFDSEESAALWRSICGKKVNLVPLHEWSGKARSRKGAEITRHYAIAGPVAFIHVKLLDNRSEFSAPLTVKIARDGGNYAIEVSGAVAIANTIAYISELIDPISLFLGLTRQNLMAQSFRYLLWGEGETGLMVYTILLRYWDRTPEDDVRPRIFLMSE